MEDEKYHALRCSDLLSIPLLKDAVVLAGKNGLDHVISRVNVMEVPDIVDWVRPGEFLMTTGYPFRKHPQAIADLIPKLAERGIAALGIKTKRFIDSVPPHVIELADKYNLPLIELPPSTVFSDIVHEVMERILIQETRDLSILQNRIQILTNLLLEGKGLDEFLLCLEQLIGNPVILLDSSNQLLLSNRTQEIIGCLVQEIPWHELRRETSMGSTVLYIGERRVKIYISVVPVHQYTAPLLILLEWNGNCAPVDTLTIDRVSALVGLELMNIQARQLVETKYIDQFLQDWLTGRIFTLSDLLLRAKACGIRISDAARYQAMIVRWIGEQPEESQLANILNELRHSAKELRVELHFTILDGDLVSVVMMNNSENGSFSQNRHVEKILKFLGNILNTYRFSLCLGKMVNSPDKINLSYTESKRVCHISSICGLQEDVVTYEQLGVYSLLYLLPDGPELEEFMSRFIQPLKEYDRKHNTSLLETMNIYFNTRCNLRATAKELFTHYNTIIYRLERVKSILNMDIEEPETQFQLQLALKLHKIYPHRDWKNVTNLNL
ncbi:purine catabolism transcriptional regulator PucR [Bacillaceae bacterium]